VEEGYGIFARLALSCELIDDVARVPQLWQFLCQQRLQSATCHAMPLLYTIYPSDEAGPLTEDPL
jgi:hypothetical protein